jgi:uncharacterized protein YjiS (DUF1127 family)
MFIEKIDPGIAMEISTATSCTRPVRRRAPRGLLGRLFNLHARFEKHRHQRTALSTLSDHVLRDIGLTRTQVERQIARRSRHP